MTMHSNRFTPKLHDNYIKTRSDWADFNSLYKGYHYTMRKIKFRKVYCEISNSCNLKCSFCPQSSLKRPTEFMQPELFESIVKQNPAFNQHASSACYG